MKTEVNLTGHDVNNIKGCLNYFLLKKKTELATESTKEFPSQKKINRLNRLIESIESTKHKIE